MTEDSNLKKLIYIASHRGTKENELLLAPFVKSQAGDLSPPDRELLGQFLQERDDDIYGWLMAHHSPPPRYVDLCQKILTFQPMDNCIV